MEQRANRARNALLAAHQPVPTGMPSQWQGEWSPDTVPPLPYEGDDGRNPRTDAARAATRAPGRPAKRGAEMDAPDAKRLHTGLAPSEAYAEDAIHPLPDLHPQFVAHDPDERDAGLVLDDALSFPMDTQYDPDTNSELRHAVATAIQPPGESLPRRLQPRGDEAQKKLTPSQEKARQAFVAAHAGQTYEQMVLERAYSSDRLYWLKEAYNLSWRTGRWSAEEEERATAALDKFCKHYKLSSHDLDELIWHRKPDQKHMHEELWKHIALSVGTRPNYAVRMHIKSMRKSVVRGGNWSPAEVEALAAAVAELGHQWEKIGARLGRSGNVCKHYWREQLQTNQPAQMPQGAFRPKEEAELRRAVLECCEQVGCAPDGPNLPWTLIHERLGPSTRRISVLSRKWRGMLSAERRNAKDQHARWYAPHDDRVLLQRYVALLTQSPCAEQSECRRYRI